MASLIPPNILETGKIVVAARKVAMAQKLWNQALADRARAVKVFDLAESALSEAQAELEAATDALRVAAFAELDDLRIEA